jgi:exodeoxyribonuclease VII large subunit
MRPRDDRTLSVAGLNRAVRFGLEREWSDVSVLGEVSDLVRAASGHAYFTLSDEVEPAQVRVVMFKSDVRRLRTPLENGARLKVRGGLTLYEARGTFQMIARSAQPAGDGNLAAHFQKLIKKLEAEGLFDPARKRPLPLLPRCVGLVTSDQGAAVHDVIRVAGERCPVRIVVSPCLVQGPDAPVTIVRALELVQTVRELDVVIVARGGGSAEDLWAFSDEQVVRAIARCRVPVVTGIGHEVDTTIADLVADVRASTPSNAAELTVPLRAALVEQVNGLVRRLERAMDSRVDREQLVLSRLLAKLRDPRRALASADAALATRVKRLESLGQAVLARAEQRLLALTRRLGPLDPRARLSGQRAALARLNTRLERSPARWLAPRAARLAGLSPQLLAAGPACVESGRRDMAERVARLEALSPLAVLSRGYAIAFSERTRRALRSAAEAAPGDALRVRLADGQLRARVVAPDGD